MVIGYNHSIIMNFTTTTTTITYKYSLLALRTCAIPTAPHFNCTVAASISEKTNYEAHHISISGTHASILHKAKTKVA